MTKTIVASKGETIRVVGSYTLTKEALKNDPALDPRILEQRQLVAFNINRQEAIRTGYIDSTTNDGCVGLIDLVQIIYAFSAPRAMMDRVGVTRLPPVRGFDHILSEEEAAKIVADNMTLYDKALAVSRAKEDERKAEESAAKNEAREDDVALLDQSLLVKNSTVSCETYEACEACEACIKRKSCHVRKAWLDCAKGLCETKLTLERKKP
jgi:hypothetical protein